MFRFFGQKLTPLLTYKVLFFYFNTTCIIKLFTPDAYTLLKPKRKHKLCVGNINSQPLKNDQSHKCLAQTISQKFKPNYKTHLVGGFAMWKGLDVMPCSHIPWGTLATANKAQRMG